MTRLHLPSWGVLAAIAVLLASDRACAAQSLVDALTGGKLDLYLRYRFEFVEDDQPRIIGGKLSKQALKDAYASTLRSALGYSTGLFYDVGAYVQFEDVRVVGDDAYNDGGSNGVADRAVVVDPEGTEIQQANLRYMGIPKTILRAGRQEIEHRKAPLHRYVGNILWRQNWQSFDAFRVSSNYLPATSLDYAYVWNVNRIFGEDNPIPDRSDFRMDSHFLRGVFNRWPWAQIEGYTYLLDFDSTVSKGFSTATYGLRFEGSYDFFVQSIKLLYTAEIAHQTDYGDNPADIDVNYYLGELGGTYTFLSGPIESVTVKGSYEVLEGDGAVSVKGCCNGKIARAFQTPLGTNHAFQGWADRFLITPADGIDDVFVTVNVKTKLWGLNAMVMWHDFSANDANYDYGSEWDFFVEKPIGNNFLVGVKYADYHADENATNRKNNSIAGQAFDLTKAWAYIQYRF